MKKWIFIALILLLIVIQFFQIDKSPVEYNSERFGFANLVDDKDAAMLTLLKDACYDCHSYEVEYPWYTSIQPIGWWIRGHIRGAQQNLNFSEWKSYPKDKARYKIKESIEVLAEKRMPPASFKLMHPEAQLTDEQRMELVSWLRGML